RTAAQTCVRCQLDSAALPARTRNLEHASGREWPEVDPDESGALRTTFAAGECIRAESDGLAGPGRSSSIQPEVVVSGEGAIQSRSVSIRLARYQSHVARHRRRQQETDRCGPRHYPV